MNIAIPRYPLEFRVLWEAGWTCFSLEHGIGFTSRLWVSTVFDGFSYQYSMVAFELNFVFRHVISKFIVLVYTFLIRSWFALGWYSKGIAVYYSSIWCTTFAWRKSSGHGSTQGRRWKREYIKTRPFSTSKPACWFLLAVNSTYERLNHQTGPSRYKRRVDLA